jgi:hypothetical protein
MDLNILLTGAVTASTSVEVRTGTNIRSVASLVIIEYAHQEEVHGARGYLVFHHGRNEMSEDRVYEWMVYEPKIQGQDHVGIDRFGFPPHSSRQLFKMARPSLLQSNLYTEPATSRRYIVDA